ncbi:MAG TPA: GlsB/YeaQ/YmgE family stress response membrane protein [Candidatus Sulfotelmatobacter sp.]|nr:GlsB/YeaQ/YmgE family stress response membrane protein [Candidatus Sulfotelmatobacter sp.]
MGIIAWIVLGAIAGFIASWLMGTREGIIGTVVLGIIGAVVGGFIAGDIFHAADVTGLNLESIVVAILGAVIVLFVWHALTGRRATTAV